MTKHKPWYVGIGGDSRHGIYDANGKWIADCTDAESARGIVVAVNHFGEMRDGLQEALDIMNMFLPAGSCDHSVGLCACKEVAWLERVDALLTKLKEAEDE